VLVVASSTQHFRGRPGCLLQVPNRPEPCRVVTEWCRVWWAGADLSIRLTWPKRECLIRLIASFIWTAAVRGWRLSRSLQTRGCRVFAFGSSYERPPVSLYQLLIVSMFQKHIAVVTGDAKLNSVTQPTLPPDTIQLGHNG